MKREELKDRSSTPVLILPMLHLILCLITEFAISDSEGGWKWFPMGIVDFPFAYVPQKIAHIMPYFWSFSIFGTLCWYGISILFRFLYTKMVLER